MKYTLINFFELERVLVLDILCEGGCQTGLTLAFVRLFVPAARRFRREIGGRLRCSPLPTRAGHEAETMSRSRDDQLWVVSPTQTRLREDGLIV
jgi:hypothetical protein